MLDLRRFLKLCQSRSGEYRGEITWSNNLTQEDSWKTHLLRINAQGALIHDSTESNLKPLIEHLQSCRLQLLPTESRGYVICVTTAASHASPAMEIYLTTGDQITFEELFVSLVYWSALRSNGLTNKRLLLPSELSRKYGGNILQSSLRIVKFQKTSLKNSHDDHASPITKLQWAAVCGSLRGDGMLSLKAYDTGKSNTELDIKKYLRSEVFELDSSLTSSDFCLFVGILPQLRKQINSMSYQNSNPCFILQFSNTIEMRTWLVALKGFAEKEIFTNSEVEHSNQLQITSTAELFIVEANINDSEMVSGQIDAYMEIMFWDNVWARTSTSNTNSGSLFWMEKFNLKEFDKIHELRLIMRHSSNDEAIAYTTLNKQKLHSGDYSRETRLPLFSVNGDTSLGSICLRISIDSLFVVQPKNYGGMEKLLGSIDLRHLVDYVYTLSNESSSVIEDVSNIFLDTFISLDREEEWFNVLVDKEVGALASSALNGNAVVSGALNSIFRGNSILTKSVELYFAHQGHEYLMKSLGSVLKEYIFDNLEKSKENTKLSGDAIEKAKDTVGLAKISYRHSLKLSEKLWDRILITSADLPIRIKNVLTILRKKLEKVVMSSKEAQDTPFGNRRIVLNSISSMLFLRFFCPIVLNPKAYGLTDTHLADDARIIMMTSSKILLNLSTLTTFNNSASDWSNDANCFIEKERENLLDYMDKVTQKKLDFTDKALNIQDMQPLPEFASDDYLRDLPDIRHGIDRTSTYTKIIDLITKPKSIHKGLVRNSTIYSELFVPNQIFLSIENSSGDLSECTISSEQDEKIDIGDLEFENVSENNIQVFGDEMMAYLEKGPTSDDSEGTGNKEIVTKDKDVFSELERECSLMYHKILRLKKKLDDFGYPSNIPSQNDKYIKKLLSSLGYSNAETSKVYNIRCIQDEDSSQFKPLFKDLHNMHCRCELFKNTNPVYSQRDSRIVAGSKSNSTLVRLRKPKNSSDSSIKTLNRFSHLILTSTSKDSGAGTRNRSDFLKTKSNKNQSPERNGKNIKNRPLSMFNLGEGKENELEIITDARKVKGNIFTRFFKRGPF